jgi:hypothetical protein
MHSGVIIGKRRGQLISTTYLTKAIEENASALGFAILAQGSPELLVTYVNEKVDVADINTIQEKNKANTMVLWLGDGQFLKNDVQPYVILKNKAGKPSLVGFLEGDFPTYAEEGSAYSRMFHATNKYLIPKLADIYSKLPAQASEKEALKKFFDQLENPLVEQDLQNLSVKRGIITLFGANGELKSIIKNDRQGTFDWGFCSDTYGYVEQAGQPPKDDKPSDEEAEKARIARIKAMVKARQEGKEGKDKDPAASSPPPAKTDPPKNTPVSQEPVLNHVVEKLPMQVRMGACPREYHKLKRVRKWYKDNALNGIVPPNAYEYPTVALKPLPKKLDSLNEARTEGASSIYKPFASGTSTEEKAEETVVPVLSKEELEKLNKELLPSVRKTTDVNQEEIMDPKRMQGLEDPIASFTEAIGYKEFQEVWGWSFQDLYKLAKISPKGAAMLICQYHAALMEDDEEETSETPDTAPAAQVSGRRQF